MIHIDNSLQKTGTFLFLRWEIWSIGGGSGLAWFLFNKEIFIRKYNPVWLIYEAQK